MSAFISPHMQYLLDQLPGAIGYKDLDSVYLGGNQQLTTYMGYEHPQDIVGLYDVDIRSQMAELAHEYVQQDQQVMAQGEQQHLDIGHYPDGDLQIHYSVKKPLYDEEGVMTGTVFNCIECRPALLKELYQHLLQQSGSGFYAVGGQYGDYALSKRESECLFYLIRGFTAKEIGRRLSISAKTIEYYVEQLKQKLNCQKRSQLIEKAISLGFLFNIPADLLPF